MNQEGNYIWALFIFFTKLRKRRDIALEGQSKHVFWTFTFVWLIGGSRISQTVAERHPQGFGHQLIILAISLQKNWNWKQLDQEPRVPTRPGKLEKWGTPGKLGTNDMMGWGQGQGQGSSHLYSAVQCITGNGHMGPPLNRMTGRYLWKHYLPATSLAGDN